MIKARLYWRDEERGSDSVMDWNIDLLIYALISHQTPHPAAWSRVPLF